MPCKTQYYKKYKWAKTGINEKSFLSMSATIKVQASATDRVSGNEAHEKKKSNCSELIVLSQVKLVVTSS